MLAMLWHNMAAVEPYMARRTLSMLGYPLTALANRVLVQGSKRMKVRSIRETSMTSRKVVCNISGL